MHDGQAVIAKASGVITITSATEPTTSEVGIEAVVGVEIVEHTCAYETTQSTGKRLALVIQGLEIATSIIYRTHDAGGCQPRPAIKGVTIQVKPKTTSTGGNTQYGRVLASTYRQVHVTRNTVQGFLFGDNIDDTRATLAVVLGRRAGNHLNTHNLIGRQGIQGRSQVTSTKQARGFAVEQNLYVATTAQLYVALQVHTQQRGPAQYISRRATTVRDILL